MTWQPIFRRGVAPQLPTEGLRALRSALEKDDRRLVQAMTTLPPPLQCFQDLPCEGACAIAYCCAFASEGQPKSVAEVEAFFARVCQAADEALAEPGAMRWFLNPFDEMPRAQMRAELLLEVDAELARRQAGADTAA
jgi:hypothetical protein